MTPEFLFIIIMLSSIGVKLDRRYFELSTWEKTKAETLVIAVNICGYFLIRFVFNSVFV